MSTPAIVRDALGLSAREAEVVDLALAGMTVPQMAAELGIGPRTVRSHVQSAYGRLNVRSRSELSAAIATRAGVDLRAAFNKLRRWGRS